MLHNILSRMMVILLIAGTFTTCSTASVITANGKPRPAFRTEVVAFEDNFMFDTPTEGSLIYRIEGDGTHLKRHSDDYGNLEIAGGPVGYVHPAQYDRPTLRLRLKILDGEPGIAVCHNGMFDNARHANPSPGVEVVLRLKDTAVRDLKTGKIIAAIPEAFPRNRDAMISVAWDFNERTLRIDLPKASYSLRLPDTVTQKGGFGLRSPSPKTSCNVSQIQILWQDNREVLIYDGYDTIYDLHGKPLGKLPPVKLPDGLTVCISTAVDLRKERTLVLLGGPDLVLAQSDTIKGWAVRDIKTGNLDILCRTPKINGCLPIQGGGGMDGYYMMQSWTYPASTCWVDWSAYDRGDLNGFVKPAMAGKKNGTTLLGFHDPGNALDGSICRYLRITETTRGVNRFTVHPNLLPYATFTDIAMPEPSHPKVSHTGPGGIPTQLVVRDRERAWYEQWAFLGNNLHSQNRGYNVFTRKDDWEGRFNPTEKNPTPFTDYANMVSNLQHPGYLLAPRYRFYNGKNGEIKADMLAIYWLKWSDGEFHVKERLAPILDRGLPPYQILFDRKDCH
ncbi:MAG: hypothetical protein ACYC27_00225 [Armatimonadota bacterium]